MLSHARHIIDVELSGIRHVRQSLGSDFADAVSTLLKVLSCGGKIIITGIGKNLPIAAKAAATLTSTGAPSIVVNPVQAMHGDLGVLNKGDAVLILSYSGESDELTTLLPFIKRMGPKIIAITCNRTNTLARNSHIVLTACVPREACPFNMAPTSSTTATLVLCDALAMVLLSERGFRREDYARLHPGGAIGRTLLLHVSDIMRTGTRLASVSEKASVKDGMLAMTRARSGSVGVISSKGKLTGVFTDGDLRRALFSNTHIMEKPIRSVMTKNPITVSAGHLAAEALHIFEEHNIDDLMVVDRAGKLVGAVDIQDLPKLKIL
jgi:arabinose-5-phosphate isomerase